MQVRKDVIVLCHGGRSRRRRTPRSSCACAHCHGFYGASSMERLPTEQALTEPTRKFKALRF